MVAKSIFDGRDVLIRALKFLNSKIETWFCTNFIMKSFYIYININAIDVLNLICDSN